MLKNEQILNQIVKWSRKVIHIGFNGSLDVKRCQMVLCLVRGSSIFLLKVYYTPDTSLFIKIEIIPPPWSLGLHADTEYEPGQ